MKRYMALAIGYTVLAGCGQSAAPGISQSAGPYQVTLETRPSPPVAGRVELLVRVSKDGDAVTDATVTAATSMPSMNMPGLDVPLAFSGSKYSGSSNMMAGEWKVVVKVSGGGESGETDYTFDVK